MYQNYIELLQRRLAVAPKRVCGCRKEKTINYLNLSKNGGRGRGGGRNNSSAKNT